GSPNGYVVDPTKTRPPAFESNKQQPQLKPQGTSRSAPISKPLPLPPPPLKQKTPQINNQPGTLPLPPLPKDAGTPGEPLIPLPEPAKSQQPPLLIPPQ
ncbi:MAG: hypothetical protein KDA77_16090, partial [Planctomycetaceae bacterium]|nr:hypothetical protein [Planctomycetaceae bacterium]